MLLSQQFATVASKNLTRPAIRYLGKELYYGDLRPAISRLSYLYQREFKPGNRVGFLTRNSPAVVLAFLALSNIRVVTVPLNPDAPPEELIEWIKSAKVTHLAVTSDLVPKARELLQGARLTMPIIEIERKQGGEYDSAYTPPPENQPLDTDTILLLRTAGITGKPKLCAFNHKQIHHAAIALRGPYRLLSTDRVLTPMNWYHPFAFVHGMLLPILNGATCVIDEGHEGLDFLSFLSDTKTTRIAGHPPFFLKLLMTCKNEGRLLPGIKSVTVGTGPLAPELAAIFHRLKIKVAQSYGQTENLWTVSMQMVEVPDDEVAQAPLAGLKYKVIDANGDTIETSEARTGMLAVTGPTVMSAYADADHEKDTKLALRGTWLYTGDIAQLEGEDQDLKIQIIGRREDLLHREGLFHSLNSLNSVLKTIPGVVDAAGFVLKNSKNESVVACAVVKAEKSTLADKHVLDACSKKLDPAVQPSIVAFTDSIPKDIAGAPNYTKLRLQFSGTAG